ncbi:MAG: ABC transporter substrate-binding protein [Planctomycetota bacterium]|jgi:peptide/nickel transport system substrate-binding protein
MEQSPLVGYFKVAVGAVLALVIFMSVMSADKTEQKIVELDNTIHHLQETVREMNAGLSQQRTHLDRLAGANETLLKAIAAGGVRAPAGPTNAGGGTNGGGTPPAVDLGLKETGGWGAHLNAGLDADTDASRPVGTPGRFKNFMKPDPYGPEGPKNAGNKDGTLRMTWGSEPKGFNLMIENYSTLNTQVIQYVMTFPGRRHKMRPSSFNWKPALAWRAEVNEDYSEYTIFLRKDIYWQPVQADTRDYPHLAGKHAITAHDFKFTYDLVKDEQSMLAHVRAYYKDLIEVEVIDDHTFVMRWTPNTFTSLYYSMHGYVMPKFVYANNEAGQPYPKETVAQEFNDHWYDQLRVGPVGCGPYRFSKFEPGKYVELERWDDWFGFKEEPLYGVKKLHYKIYNESETAMNWLRKGDTDIGGLNGTRRREWVLEETDMSSPFKNGDIIIETAPTTSYLYIGWKNSDPMFADKRVRQALTYACDRFTVCNKIFGERYEAMASNVWPFSEEADKNLKPYPFDPEKAKKLLDAAGWGLNPDTGLREKEIGGKVVQFRFTLNWPGPSSEFQNALDHYKNDLLKIGIEMTPLSQQWAQFQKDLRDRKFKAFSLLWVTDGWEHDFKQIWHSRQIKDPGSSNYIEFAHPEVDKLQDELDHTMDAKRRVEIIHRIGRILYEEQPYTFFGWAKVFRCHWKHVKGWEDYRYYARPLLRFFPLWIDK